MQFKFNIWTPKSWKRWEQTRAKGKNYVIFGMGVCGWGGLMFICLTLLQELDFLSSKPTNSLLYNAASNFIFFAIGGYFWGYCMWHIMEFLYRQYSHKKED